MRPDVGGAVKGFLVDLSLMFAGTIGDMEAANHVDMMMVVEGAVGGSNKCWRWEHKTVDFEFAVAVMVNASFISMKSCCLGIVLSYGVKDTPLFGVGGTLSCGVDGSPLCWVGGAPLPRVGGAPSCEVGEAPLCELGEAPSCGVNEGSGFNA